MCDKSLKQSTNCSYESTQGENTIAGYCSVIAIQLQLLYETNLPCHPESG